MRLIANLAEILKSAECHMIAQADLNWGAEAGQKR